MLSINIKLFLSMSRSVTNKFSGSPNKNPDNPDVLQREGHERRLSSPFFRDCSCRSQRGSVRQSRSRVGCFLGESNEGKRDSWHAEKRNNSMRSRCIHE